MLNSDPYSDTHSIISSGSSIDSSPMSIECLSNHLSTVYYNVQSITNKIDILSAELRKFDILAFFETWLNSTIKNDILLIDSNTEPERKDRQGDSHDGVMIYIKDSIHYKHRHDLEPNGIECVWIEMVVRQNTYYLFFFYRPPPTLTQIIYQQLKTLSTLQSIQA